MLKKEESHLKAAFEELRTEKNQLKSKAEEEREAAESLESGNKALKVEVTEVRRSLEEKVEKLRKECEELYLM